ncbi:HDOD domain-containing protein [Aquincola sp. J276]|uniref:HDOD domain-containing protein n=1 Tax=Aquincola sp. J276 TaxID=2898432 RepID=UPI0021513A85|nr:HDOD domain-containing protein [Aquincola sp. J276]MCR5865777.1 HDOD domain-containing protein [Aquincola sp. J276]
MPPLLDNPLPTLEAWVAHFRDAPVPVLADSADQIEAFAANEDAVDAHTLAEALGDDPFLTVRVLAHVGRHHRRDTGIETLTAALVLMGVPPFFRTFGQLPTVEDRLQAVPGALEGLRRVLSRAHRAARFALGFAVQRLDHDAMVIREAALLHDLAEMLLWCHAPRLALEIARRQQADGTLRSATAQQQVLGVALCEVQQALMKAWSLPDLLLQLDAEHGADTPSVRNVRLAVRVARHSAQGWANAALPDDLSDIAQLLRLNNESTLALLHEIDD